MDINELKLAWDGLDRRLDANIRLNQQFVIAAKLCRAKTPIRRLTLSLSVEAATAFCILLVLGNFIFKHIGEPRFAWPAALLDVWVIASLAGAIRQLLFISRIDYDRPIVEIQRRIEELRLSRLRFVRWALITSQVVWWLPFLIVAFKAFFGIDVYRTFGYPFLYINGLASGAILLLSIWLSKGLSQRTDRSRFLQMIARHIEGKYINLALNSLAGISAFESEVTR